jgi:hypothetical protein
VRTNFGLGQSFNVFGGEKVGHGFRDRGRLLKEDGGSQRPMILARGNRGSLNLWRESSRGGVGSRERAGPNLAFDHARGLVLCDFEIVGGLKIQPESSG